jgi:hypothetical protein
VHREKGEVILIFRVFFAIESEVFVPIINARIFDGESILDGKTVVIEGQNILAVSDEMPEGATLIDASGATILPGLIDSHVHTNMPQLRLALTFGVTTELEMMGHWTPEQRKEVAESDDMADLRTAELVSLPQAATQVNSTALAVEKAAEALHQELALALSLPSMAIAMDLKPQMPQIPKKPSNSLQPVSPMALTKSRS